jgi:hypothetical protein
MGDRRRIFERLGAIALREAECGNLQPLIGRILSKEPLTDGEREFVAIFLDQHDGRRGAAYLRRIERALIRGRVEGLRAEGMKLEAAVALVMRERGLSRATVFKALNAPQTIGSEP